LTRLGPTFNGRRFLAERIAGARELMLAKSAASGLSPADAKTLGFEPFAAPPAAISPRGPGFTLPYFNLQGKRTGFYRYRFLPPVLCKGKERKYSQPGGAPPEAYFSPLFPWTKYLKERQGEKRVLLLTEGELKANCGAKYGFPVIGLGGVCNYKAQDSELLPDLEAIDWKDAAVYSVYDSDAADNANVSRAEDGLASLLVQRGAHVRVVRLPQLTPGEKTGLDDFLVARGVAEFRRLLEETEEWKFSRRIFHSEPLHRAVEKAESILALTPGYKLFVRGSELVRVVEEGNEPNPQDVFRRPKGSTYLAGMTAANVEYLLSTAKCVWAPGKKTRAAYLADPKVKWCAQIVARLTGFPERVPWNRLDLVTNTPLLLEDGGLVDAPGYHAGTGVWFDPQGREFPGIPARPTKREARQALELFSRVFGKFPFVSDEHYAAVLATILGVLARHLLPTVPLLGITAPEGGSGKTKIAEAIGGATTGCLLARMSYGNSEEFDKQIPIPLKECARIILIDNIDIKYVKSERLETALTTAAAIRWRLLGLTVDQVLLNRSVFIAVGNHLVLAGKLPRRSLLCRLVPNVARPEARVFDFEPVARSREMFHLLTMAGLTALRYYLQAGCPQPRYAPGVALESGSFEGWNRLVRGLLVHLDFGDPLATQEELHDENPYLASDIELVQALRKLFPREEAFSASSIYRAAGSDAFGLILGSDQKWNPERAGFRLRALKDRVLEGLKVERVGVRHGSARYRVVEMGKGGGA
jgi:Domain of unknown function (DUF3854)